MDDTKKAFLDEIRKLAEEYTEKEQHKKTRVFRKESSASNKSASPALKHQKRIINRKIQQNKKAVSIRKENATSLIHQSFNFFKEYEEIDEIVDYLAKQKFNNKYSKEEILDILNKNSFNIKATFTQLKANDFDASFTQKDDYIIKFMTGSDLYQHLCSIKGKTNVERRRAYLQVDDY